MAYNEVERAIAVQLVSDAGGVLDAATLDQIRAALNRPGLTSVAVRNWLKQKAEQKNFPEEKKAIVSAAVLEQAAGQALDDMFEEVARRYLQHSVKPEVIDATKGKDAVIAAATAVDKMRLIRGLPTEIIALLPPLVTAMEEAGLSPSDVFNNMLRRLNAQAGKVSKDA